MEPTPPAVDAVRRFSRFYTKRIGLLGEVILQSPFTLPEARVIYEIAHQGPTSVTDLARELSLDPGYLSRVVTGLSRQGVVRKTRSTEDRRRMDLSLTEEGGRAYDALNSGSDRQIAELLAGLTPPDREEIVHAMDTVRHLLGDGRPADVEPFKLRPHRPGDLGWVVQRHGELYARELGWDASFEAMCAGIAAAFLEGFDPRWERSWIAEREGRRVGCVFLVRESDTVGRLRMLLVEPAARGLGLGARLVAECVSHARHVGYRKLTLFTVHGLDSARRLYEAEGFTLTHQEPERVGGEERLGQSWELAL